MSRLGTIARRTFLLGTAAIAGGVAFGYYQYARALPNPLPTGDGNHPITPYVTIDQDGVTIITPRAEMGQGVYTTLAALVAEELDVNWEDISVQHGPPDQAYYNGGLMSHGLPVNDYERSGFQDMMIEAMTVIPKMAALQVTGGSTSMLDAYEKMRLAGASARETLKQAAADRLGLSRSAMATEGGAVIPPDGTPIPYTDLAEAAAEIEPITRGIELRSKANWRYLGQSMPRTDMLRKSTGTAMFGSDVRLEGMKFATVRMSPRLGGEILRFDASAAEAMAGVERVIDLGTGIAVVANNTWIAIQAAETVEIEWGPAPYPETSEELMQVIRASLDNEPNSTLRNDGDADESPLQSDIQIEAEYTMPWLAHSTMEPMNATAIYSSDALTLWCGTQAPILAEQKAAEAVGLDPEQVTCHVTYLGGGFGRRGEFDYAVLAARVAREIPDTPVKVTWSREEDMRHDFYRPAAAARMRGVIREGFAHTLDGRMAAPSVTQQSLMRIAGFSPPGPDKGHVEGMFNQPYAIPNYRVQGHLTDLAVPIGFWRSVGNSINGFFMESFIDEMAHAAGRDPLAFRLELARGEHAASAGVLEAVADMANWSGETPDGIGRGVAMTFSFHTPVAIAMEVSDQDGVISMDRAWIACDVGTALDPGIIEQQMVSGLVYGLTAAVMGEISFSGGEVDQYNFPDYDALRIHQVPETEVRILETQHHIGGVGEPSTPPSMPALANAIYDLTGERVRDLPLNRRFDFVF
ncbi:molybdopterin-dependent oxidoreductase [Roseobacter sp. HKCCD9010]|uniref:xanthine dehydrogenase family protein molybdopterin-binding subunit n=1 Tax=unclassified Roseobacter TaxID=196798 RepID=UPI0014920CA6|nr:MULTISPECIES: molybdopterin cofactor-binding domain-containing protein [unclassified Roseobacter]MBF9049217.1 molybdopterin-dependent oxidoreductase [Rhodobacterales bacterium HKCCD4356]NNV11217.1 molybdopterin-dependent oxidoreductase [Roseobacter sp. HKCCD7357]NNV15401.1 molybdopterin-dependent oxidoreductase [Roseobacter sp. HKCCD8768]NNV24861.1 molybdopterin-dependent oxidoreductase [Roseobacter sp. HKCCD8192]NNV29117.1 molybdopterin-dependent oxidoreductase [Roseobacter sp. HKCCD9061]